MTEARIFLINTLRRVIGGGDVTNHQLNDAIADATSLRGAERKAWHGLSYWADDDDIRAKDPAYAPSRRRQLADLLNDLERDHGVTPSCRRYSEACLDDKAQRTRPWRHGREHFCVDRRPRVDRCKEITVGSRVVERALELSRLHT